MAGLMFQDAVQAIVKKSGSNGLTRAALLQAMTTLTNFFTGRLSVASRRPVDLPVKNRLLSTRIRSVLGKAHLIETA